MTTSSPRWAALALAIASVLHPAVRGPDVAAQLRDVLALWQLVHVAQLLLFPLVAVAAYGSLSFSAPRDRAVARVAFAAFAVSEVAFDSLIGLGTGTLVLLAPSTPAASVLIDRYFATQSQVSPAGLLYLIAGLSWLMGMGMLARSALRERSMARASLFAVSGVALAISHVAPFGTVAMLALLLAWWWPAPAHQDGSAAVPGA